MASPRTLVAAAFVALSFTACNSDDDGVNRAPVANDDSATATRGQTITINVLSNDTDPDGDDLDLATVNSPSGGTATPASIESGTVTYVAPSTAGTYRFDYTATDGRLTDNATVTVTVQ